MALSQEGANAVAVGTAAIALVGVLITAIVSLSASRRATYLNVVTAERSKWIEKLRDNFSRLIALAHTLDSECYRDDNFYNTAVYRKLVAEIVEVMALIRLQLNPQGKIDANILGLIFAIPDHAGTQDYKKLERLIVRHVQWLLKEEWEKVKYEARSFFGRLWARYKAHGRHKAYDLFCDGEGAITPWQRSQ